MESPVVSVARAIPVYTGTRISFPIAFPNVQEAAHLDKDGNGVVCHAIFASGDDRPERVYGAGRNRVDLGAAALRRRTATRARSILRWKIRYNAVCVAARDGHVILSRHVFSNLDRDAAEHTIRKMTGVVTLTNRIVTISPLICKQHRGLIRPAPKRGAP